ncbi:MAG: GNAT family N-acetyltransferase [Candidatus Rokuibacteriota bacterium]
MGGSALRTAWPSSFPELATRRLRLRAPLPRDAAALLSILGDPEVTRYHNMPTLTTLAEAHGALERLEQRYAARDTIRWAIELTGHGEMIGTVGLLRFDFEQRRAEVGYEMARRWWGRGFTPEAVAAVIRYGFTVVGLHRIEAGVLPGNDASVRVLQKLGFLEEGTRRDYLHFKGGFHSFRWFSRLETDESPGTAR